MAITAQDKILHVANQLGLTSLKNMQATTGAVYDSHSLPSSSYIEFFKNVNQKTWPDTNISSNQFQVNEALLIESISITGMTEGTTPGTYVNSSVGGQAYFFTYEIVIGNKTVVKTQKIRWGMASMPGNQGLAAQGAWMEGVGILIPPQVEFQVNVQAWNTSGTLAVQPWAGGDGIPNLVCVLYGTQVLLDLNTSL
jgi:hypothetical protein